MSNTYNAANQSVQGGRVVNPSGSCTYDDGSVLQGTSQSGIGWIYEYVVNGCVTTLDTNGSGVGHYDYDPYGHTSTQTCVFSGDFPSGFSSKCSYSETSLYYYGLRFYKSEIGRWISRDPIGEDGGRNLYVSCANNHVLYTDSLGDRTCCEEALDKVWNVAGAQIADLFLRGCLDRIVCRKECGRTGRAGGHYNNEKENGSVFQTVCIRESDLDTSVYTMQTILHELQHADTQCGSKNKDCNSCLHDELKAHRCSGEGSNDLSLLNNCKDLCPKARNKGWFETYGDQIKKYREQVKKEKCWFQKKPDL